MARNTFIRITGDTTDAAIMAPIAEARARLAEEAKDAAANVYLFKGDLLVRLAQAVKDQEHLANAQIRYRNLCRTNASVLRRMQALGTIAITFQDTYSGRNNDSQRAAQDVVREWALHQMSLLED